MLTVCPGTTAIGSRPDTPARDVTGVVGGIEGAVHIPRHSIPTNRYLHRRAVIIPLGGLKLIVGNDWVKTGVAVGGVLNTPDSSEAKNMPTAGLVEIF